MTKPVDYWSLVEPVWLPLNSTWGDPEKFVREFRRVRAEAGPGNILDNRRE